MSESFLNDRVTLHCGDCLDVLVTLPEHSIDSCVTDPPYGLQFMGREWDKLWRNETEADAAYVERTNGELTSRAHKLPDYKATNPQQMQEWHTAWARQVYRALKPGAHLLAFGGTRTYHRMACAIEDAGFEIRDTILWLYGQGFPKSHDVSKGIDRVAGAERTGGFVKAANPAGGIGLGFNAQCANCGKWKLSPDPCRCIDTGPATDAARQWQGWGSALKPAAEMVCMARKPLSERTIAANVLKWGTGAINVDGCRVETDWTTDPTRRGWQGCEGNGTNQVNGLGQKNMNNLGRWPANVILSVSEDEYILRGDTTPEQKRELYRWMSENA